MPHPYSHKRRQKRAAMQARAHAWVVHPVAGPLLERDPLLRAASSGWRRLGYGVLMLLCAALLEGGVGALLGVGAQLWRSQADVSAKNQQIEIEVVDIPPPPEDVPEVETEDPAPYVPPKPKSKPKPKPKKPKPKPKPKEPPPPDPIDVPKAPSPKTAAKPRRIVGLSLDSTSARGGSGPTFAVGNTRMGNTAKQAEDPNTVQKLVNKASNRIPTARVPVSRPKRLGQIKPVYPALLNQQGLEADVVLRITVNATGEVVEVVVVRGALYPEFNDAAVAAAKKQRYAPATRGGKAIPFTFRYTTRFRLDDP